MPQTELLKKKTHVTDIPLTIYTCRLLQQHDAVGLQSGLWVVNLCPFRQIFYQFFSKKSLCSFFVVVLFFLPLLKHKTAFICITLAHYY